MKPTPGMENAAAADHEPFTRGGFNPGSDPEMCVVDMRRQPSDRAHQRVAAQYSYLTED